jgi:hypothetical protein
MRQAIVVAALALLLPAVGQLPAQQKDKDG